MIIVDKREKNSMVLAELKARGIAVKEQLLDIGDYIIGNTIIERKTISDFIGSMINKRLIKQLIALNETNFENKLFILEGYEEEELYDRGSLNNNAIRGMLLSIILDHKIPVIFTKDYLDTTDFLILILKRQEKKPREISLVAKPRFTNIYEQQEFIVESFPGIGKALAREILKKFKSIKAFVNANLSELMSIKKLGEKKARKIKQLIDAEYKTREELQDIAKESGNQDKLKV